MEQYIRFHSASIFAEAYLLVKANHFKYKVERKRKYEPYSCEQCFVIVGEETEIKKISSLLRKEGVCHEVVSLP